MKDPGIWDEVTSETVPHLHGTEVKWNCLQSCHYHNQSKGAPAYHSQEMKAGLVWTCHSTWCIAQDSSSEVGGGRTLMRQAEKMVTVISRRELNVRWRIFWKRHRIGPAGMPTLNLLQFMMQTQWLETVKGQATALVMWLADFVFLICYCRALQTPLKGRKLMICFK